MSYSRSNAAAAAKEAKVVDLFQQIALDSSQQKEDKSDKTADEASGEGEETNDNVGKNTENTDAYCLFVGDKGGGKSCLVGLFMGKEEDVKPTVALDYQFARRPRAGSTNNSKDISHVWELGGNLSVPELISIPLRRGLDKSVVVVVVDTGRPENVVRSLKKWLDLVRDRIDVEMREFEAKEPARAKAMFEEAERRFGVDHPDFSSVNISPVPIVIVANKYDKLKEEDSAGRRCLMQALRFVAHGIGATLVFASTRDKQSRDLFRSVARQSLFDQGPVASAAVEGGSEQQQQDAKWKKAANFGDSAPLAVKPGCDTFEAILAAMPKGTVKSDFVGHNGIGPRATETWAKSLEVFYGRSTLDDKKEEAKLELDDEGENDGGGKANSYPEPAVDEARAAANLRLTQYKKEVQRRQEIAAAAIDVEKPRERERKSRKSSDRDKSSGERRRRK
ncbi:hypothetical protein TrST_g8769 [Triparma strigata]|uniref:Cytoplasmic dynein 2 light intermediate chain 1 n=1 Tax=Triparma strigata TaxID=1606541 RepID=A0A9W7ASZ2_9STRA|nr:hypothetical protein TrST_g8769 [Triparma strigata]